MRPRAKSAALIAITTFGILGVTLVGQSGPRHRRHSEDERMSSMGRAAALAREKAEGLAPPAVGLDVFGWFKEEEPGECVNEPRCGSGLREGLPAGTQAELSIAVDSTGQNIVIGFNDFRGFTSNPLSVSGFMFSSDGGQTFVDGGQLPSPGNDSLTIGGVLTKFPQVYGDPELEYLGGCTFIYSSIILTTMINPSGTKVPVQTMGVHRSTDCGHTWEGPFEVTGATNPNGQFSGTGFPLDAADKEFMSADPETGRVIMTWTNFTAPTVTLGQVQMSSSYTDNILANPPTWSSAAVVAATLGDGQGSMPAFDAGSSNAYVAWARYPILFFGYANTIAFARSTDNGATWNAPIELSSAFFTIDHILGNDRVHTFPSIAVDNSGGALAGNIYVTYVNNNSADGADVVFQRSTDGGLTFSTPLLLNSRPGDDRAQWFPSITVDRTTGRVHVFYYDQGIAASGDVTEVTHTYSDDGGVHWAAPQPLSRRPFHAGWGNDTSQPNLGDYNQAVAQDGELFAAWAGTERPPLGFTDGQPSASMTTPDPVFRRYSPALDEEEADGIKPTTLDLQQVSFLDSGGNGHLDPGETATFQFLLRNYVTNTLNAARARGIQATLSTSTPGVLVTRSRSHYDNINPGASAWNKQDFFVSLLPSFVAGTAIEFQLYVQTADYGSATLFATQFTGTPVPTVLLSQDFNGAAPGTLPSGWIAAHGAGLNTVRWTTTDSFCGTSNGAFHVNANDGPDGQHTRWERLISPAFVVPAGSEYVIVEFDVCYDSEDDPYFNVLGYDGFFLRLTDLTSGRLLRSVLVEAFADEFVTGTLFHYPRHLPRSGNPAYFQDMSAWAGYSNGIQHVRMRLPGMAGSTAQLRFEYTQDGIATCADVRPGPRTCGVFVDNVVVTSVTSAIPAP